MKNFYLLIPLWMQKYVKNEKRYRLINFICLLAVYKRLIGTGRVLGTSIFRYVLFSACCEESKQADRMPRLISVFKLLKFYDFNAMTMQTVVTTERLC